MSISLLLSPNSYDLFGNSLTANILHVIEEIIDTLTATTLGVTGNASIGGTLGVTGTSTLSSLLATTGTFSGALSAASGAISGALSSGALTSTTGTFSGTLSGVDQVLSGDISAHTEHLTGLLTGTSGTFSSNVTMQNLNAAIGTFSNNVSMQSLNATGNGTFAGNVSMGQLTATIGTFSDNVSMQSLNATGNGTFAGNLSAVSTNLSGDLVAQHITGNLTVQSPNLITTWAVGNTYQIGQLVTYQKAIYSSLINSNLGNTPSLGSADWLLLSSYMNLQVLESQLVVDGVNGALLASGKIPYLPFQSLLEALQYNGSPSNTVIQIQNFNQTYGLGGGYTVTQNNLYITSDAVVGDASNIISDPITVDTGSNFQLENVQLTHTTAITYQGTSGMSLQNIFFNNNSPGITTILFQNNGSNLWGGIATLYECRATNPFENPGASPTIINITGNPNPGTQIAIINYIGSLVIDMQPNQTGVSLYCIGCESVLVQNHTFGTLVLNNCYCEGLTSTCANGNGSLIMRDVTFYNPSSNLYNVLNKSGTCELLLNYVDHNRSSTSTDTVNNNFTNCRDSPGFQSVAKYVGFNNYSQNDVISYNNGGSNTNLFRSLITPNTNNTPGYNIAGTSWELITNKYPLNALLSTSPAATSATAASVIQLTLPTITTNTYSIVSSTSSAITFIKGSPNSYALTIYYTIDNTSTVLNSGAYNIFAGTTNTYPGVAGITDVVPYVQNSGTNPTSTSTRGLVFVAPSANYVLQLYVQNLSAATFNITINAISVSIVG